MEKVKENKEKVGIQKEKIKLKSGKNNKHNAIFFFLVKGI